MTMALPLAPERAYIVATQTMSDRNTITIELPEVTNEQLGRLSERTKRAKSILAADAIADYVARELETVAGIERGLADMRAGRVVPHDEAMARLRQTIDRAAKSKM
jgi:predicted transcriptional regulator